MKKKMSILLAFALALVFALSGCQSKTEEGEVTVGDLYVAAAEYAAAARTKRQQFLSNQTQLSQSRLALPEARIRERGMDAFKPEAASRELSGGDSAAKDEWPGWHTPPVLPPQLPPQLEPEPPLV